MSVDSCARDKGCPFSGITSSGRVWRKVSESDAQSVGHMNICMAHEFGASHSTRKKKMKK